MAKVLELTNEDPRFYQLVGPFLARRDVHRAIGGIPWDDDAKTWFVHLDTQKNVVGFCAVASRGNRTVVESLYVTYGTGHDRRAATLLAAAVARYGDRELTTVVRNEIAELHTAVGFTPTKQARPAKQFTTLTRPAQEKKK